MKKYVKIKNLIVILSLAIVCVLCALVFCSCNGNGREEIPDTTETEAPPEEQPEKPKDDDPPKEIIFYTLAYNADEGGAIEGEKTQKVEKGKNGSSVIAVPAEGYNFTQWSDGYTSPIRQETNVKTNITLTAKFEKITCTITYTTDGNGTIEGEKTQTLAYGEDSKAVTAVPTEGYKFVKWSDGNANPTRQETNVYANVFLTAKFEKLTYTVTYTTDGNGTIEGEKTQTLEYGEDSKAVTAVPAEGYKFTQWSDGNTNPIRQETNVNANVSLTAKFERITYTVTYVVSNVNYGHIVGQGRQTVYYGEDTTAVSVAVSVGYKFVKWSDGNTNPTRQETNVKTNITLTAIFEKLTFTITYTTDGSGTIEGETIQTLEYGKQYSSVLAVPDTGYRFVQWSDGNTFPRRALDYAYEDKTVTAVFEEITLRVTYMVSGGYFLVDGERFEQTYTQYVKYGGNTSKKIEVVHYDPRQSFIKWSDGVETEERQDLNVTEDIFVQAIFGIKLTYSVDGNKGGKLIGDCYQVVDVGKDAEKVIAVPDDGYVFGGWSDLSFDLERQEKGAMATFDYVAYFEPIEKTFKYDYGEVFGAPLQDKVIINRYKLNEVKFVLPELQGYTFCGWYSDKEYKMKLANENGKLMLGYYTFNLETDTIYAKWESNSAEEKLTYKILMIHVDSLQASPYFDKLGKNIDVDYKMTTLEKKILALNTIRFQSTMNNLFSERETNFQIEMYFTTDLLEPDMPDWESYWSVYGDCIPEVKDITDAYGSVITVFGLRNWRNLSVGTEGTAYIKYAALNIDCFFATLQYNYIPLQRIYESLLEDPDSFYKAELYLHEFTHTIEVHYQLGISTGMDTIVQYHKILGCYSELDNLMRTKRYLLCEFEMDGKKVGIPREFWENPSYWEEDWWYSNTQRINEG